MSNINHRYDFVMFVDVKDGNPNGDPDAGNMPRIDPETGEGLMSDVCLKRKVRNFIQIAQLPPAEDFPEHQFDIFVKEKAVLNTEMYKVAREEGLEFKKEKEVDKEKRGTLCQALCHRFYDIRTFGSVLSTGPNAGQVRGPIQFTFARSIDPVVTFEHSITRMAVTNEKDADKERTMGRKYTIPYGLYKVYGFVSPHFADKTDFTSYDLEVFWDALQRMFDVDHSAARGLMSTRKLIVFEHDSKLGDCSATQLFDRVKVTRVGDKNKPARDFSDYEISLDGEKLGSEVKHVVSAV